MKDRVEPVEGGPTGDGKRTTITLSVEMEDAERLLQAFKDGKFSEFGVIDCKVIPEESPAKPEKKWGTGELGKRTAKGDGTPPLPS
jgi:hypothetical protein